MQAIPDLIFKDHNDAHLRIWFAQSASGPFELLSPDQAIGAVPYALNTNVAAGNSSSGNVSNSSGSQSTPSGPASVVSMAGGFVRLIANGPTTPSSTLVLLAGDTAEVLAYVGETTGLLEYSFGEHGFVLPKTFDSFPPDPDRSGQCTPDRPHGWKNLCQFTGPPGQWPGQSRLGRRCHHWFTSTRYRIHSQPTNRGARRKNFSLRIRVRG